MLILLDMPYLLVFFLSFFLSTSVFSETVNVAVASNFKETAQQLKQAFEADHLPAKIQIISASSAKLYTQILQGAPFDLFLSADAHLPHKLTEQHHSLQGPYRYAQGRLALWSAKESIDVKQCLEKRCFHKLAMANPKLAPYGMASRQTLRQLKLYSSIRPQLVQSENIHQTFQFIHSQNVDLGFVALSQLRAYSISSNIWLIPEQFYEPINQDAVLLNQAKKNNSALLFWQFLKSQRAQKIIQQSGYLTP